MIIQTTQALARQRENQIAPMTFCISALILGLWLSLSSIKVSAEEVSNPTLVTQQTQPKLGVQLWSVRGSLKRDFKGTIKKLSELGFQGVELAGEFGVYGSDPKGLAAFIKSQGMEISSAHVNYESLSDDNFADTIEFYKSAGVPMLVIGYDIRMGDKTKIQSAVDELKRLTPKVESHGLLFGYHNHDFEFSNYEPSDGYATFWDYIAQSTPHSFVLQMDVGWVNVAGLNPIEFVRKYPGRTIITHYKSRSKPGVACSPEPVDLSFTLLGQDGFDWAELFRANRTVGGTQWVVLEQEDYPNGLSDIESVAVSKRGLDKVLKEAMR